MNLAASSGVLYLEAQIIESHIFIDTHFPRQLAWNNCCSILFQGRLFNQIQQSPSFFFI